MNKTIIAVICVVAIAICAFFVLKSVRVLRASASQAAPQLPSKYVRISPGWTQNQVLADLGKPKLRSLNPRFESKTPQQWAKIEAVADSGAGSTDLSAAPNMQVVKAGAELEHRTKEMWRYAPTPGTYVVIEFDAAGRVIKWFSGQSNPSGHR